MNAGGDGKEMNAQILLYYTLFLGGLFIALNAALWHSISSMKNFGSA